MTLRNLRTFHVITTRQYGSADPMQVLPWRAAQWGTVLGEVCRSAVAREYWHVWLRFAILHCAKVRDQLRCSKALC